MKSYVCLFAVVFLWCALMPNVIRPSDGGQAAATETCEEESKDISEMPNIQVSYYDNITGEIMETQLEEYVARALTGLMDGDAPMEALKAQAVAIRSVVCYRYENREHEGFYLCDDAEHCFKLAEKPGDRCIEAVSSTRGRLLTYGGKAALALSHLSSLAKTESYKTVYGDDIPYLVSVAVSDESASSEYKAVYKVSYEEFKQAFSDYKTVFNDDKKTWIGNITYTEGGRVYTIEIGGLCFKGATFAKLFGVQSLCFNIEESNRGFDISCYGNGHGVGMSRSSAVLMAKEGKSYKEILAYFYPQTQLSVINNA